MCISLEKAYYEEVNMKRNIQGWRVSFNLILMTIRVWSLRTTSCETSIMMQLAFQTLGTPAIWTLYCSCWQARRSSSLMWGSSGTQSSLTPRTEAALWPSDCLNCCWTSAKAPQTPLLMSCTVCCVSLSSLRSVNSRILMSCSYFCSTTWRKWQQNTWERRPMILD